MLRAHPWHCACSTAPTELVRKVLASSYKGKGGKEVKRKVSHKPGVLFLSSGYVREQGQVLSNCYGFAWFNCFGNCYKKPASIPRVCFINRLNWNLILVMLLTL